MPGGVGAGVGGGRRWAIHQPRRPGPAYIGRDLSKHDNLISVPPNSVIKGRRSFVLSRFTRCYLADECGPAPFQRAPCPGDICAERGRLAAVTVPPPIADICRQSTPRHCYCETRRRTLLQRLHSEQSLLIRLCSELIKLCITVVL